MPLPKHSILHIAACLCAAFVTGCDRSEARARDALDAYQTAAATNDLVGAKRALLELVRAKDDVPDYWVELGKTEVSMGDLGSAYYAFTRAYELDRRNPELVRTVVQLALRSGDMADAQSHAEELQILAPGDPWVQLAKGWAAVGQLHFDQAMAASDTLLASTPYDPAATVLKARALIGLQQEDEAIDLLQKQVTAQPTDAGSLQLLTRIFARRNDWANAASTAHRIAIITPMDPVNNLVLVQAALRAGKIAEARTASSALLQPNADPTAIASVLDLWADYWPSSQRTRDAMAFANRAAGLNRKLVYAAFLNRVGDTRDAMALSQSAATLPVDANNAEANAILADSLSRAGNVRAAKARFDAVIAYDPGNATALRGRAELLLRMHQAKAAVADAQKLVTVLPSSARDRLLLAQSFAAAGNMPWVDRTLWTAFQDLPTDEKIFAALLESKRGNADVAHDVEEEFARQRDARLSRGLI